MILQRYTFGSKSQQDGKLPELEQVAYDIAKIYIWKQITTFSVLWVAKFMLLMILQRYTFGSKSQHCGSSSSMSAGCLWYCKDIHLEANHN